jgi:hypothetical protein
VATPRTAKTACPRVRHADGCGDPGAGIPGWLAEPDWVEPKLDGFPARLILDHRLEGGRVLESGNGRALAAPGLLRVERYRPSMVLDGQ